MLLDPIGRHRKEQQRRYARDPLRVDRVQPDLIGRRQQCPCPYQQQRDQFTQRMCPRKQHDLSDDHEVKAESEVGRNRGGECDRHLRREINDPVAQDLKRSVTDVKNTLDERPAEEASIEDSPFFGPETWMPEDPGCFP